MRSGAVLRSRGFVTMSATRWGRGGAVAGKVRVTSCEKRCSVEISRGLSQCLPHGGGGVGLWRGKYE